MRPDVTATATYGADGRIAELLIAPVNSGLIKSRGKTMSQEAVKQIIDELVPISTRGKLVMSGFVNMGCLPEDDCAGTSTTYERITIYYNAAAERVYYAVVQWRK